MKKCSKCKTEKSLDDFHNDRSRSKDGKVGWCKVCILKRLKDWQDNNKERYSENHRNYRRLHKNSLLIYQRLWAEKNKERIKNYRKTYRLKHPKKDREGLLRYYGLTIQQYEAMLCSQDGLCAICKSINISGRNLCVDHCHKTGEVRGLLCDFCNKGLGIFKDNKAFLMEAAKYLERYE